MLDNEDLDNLVDDILQLGCQENDLNDEKNDGGEHISLEGIIPPETSGNYFKAKAPVHETIISLDELNLDPSDEKDGSGSKSTESAVVVEHPLSETLAEVSPLKDLENHESIAPIPKSHFVPILRDDSFWRLDSDHDDVYLLRRFPLYTISANVLLNLYPHQRQGVAFLLGLFHTKCGGILADDMGLGKTVQVAVFLRIAFASSPKVRCLIVVPLSLLTNWRRELIKWFPGVFIQTLHGAKRRQSLLVEKTPGVVLTTYATLQKTVAAKRDYDVISFDLIVLDEGHRIKNIKTLTHEAVSKVLSPAKILLTGTPILNRLQELWVLLDYTCNGKLLGTRMEFADCFEDAIMKGSLKEATSADKIKSEYILERLRRLIEPYVLRREKIMLNNNPPMITSTPQLPNKIDIAIFLSMTNRQIELYANFLKHKRVLQETKAHRAISLVVIKILQILCNHPNILKRSSRWANEVFPEGRGQVKSGKLSFVHALLYYLVPKHRILVFSNYIGMLDRIQKRLVRKNIVFLRLDGSVADPSERQQIADRFNGGEGRVLLMTTQVGGVGMNLVGADRVVVVDPSWSSAIDDQAVDRAYRIGQKKDVIVYRLISSGTVEEHMYRIQCFKRSLSSSTVGDGNPAKMFSHRELQQLFEFGIGDSQVCVTHELLEPLCGNGALRFPENSVIKDIIGFPYYVDHLDHGRLYSKYIDSGRAIKKTKEKDIIILDDSPKKKTAVRIWDLSKKTLFPMRAPLLRAPKMQLTLPQVLRKKNIIEKKYQQLDDKEEDIQEIVDAIDRVSIR